MKTWVPSAESSQVSAEDLVAMACEGLGPGMDTEVDSRERGLYVATSDAGIRHAVQFWADALVETPRFASPAGFPWTLANASAGQIARTLDIHGPNYSIVGGDEAILSAVQHALQELTQKRVREAIVVVLHQCEPRRAIGVILGEADAQAYTPQDILDLVHEQTVPTSSMRAAAARRPGRYLGAAGNRR